MRITPAGCDIIPKSDDSGTLECELVLLVNCVAKKLSTCEIVTDAYSTCFECEAERCESKLDSESIKLSDSHSVTAKLSCQDGEIRCVHDSWATISNVTSRLDEEKKAFIISGSVTFCIIGKNVIIFNFFTFSQYFFVVSL